MNWESLSTNEFNGWDRGINQIAPGKARIPPHLRTMKQKSQNGMYKDLVKSLKGSLIGAND